MVLGKTRLFHSWISNRKHSKTGGLFYKSGRQHNYYHHAKIFEDLARYSHLCKHLPYANFSPKKNRLERVSEFSANSIRIVRKFLACDTEFIYLQTSFGRYWLISQYLFLCGFSLR